MHESFVYLLALGHLGLSIPTQQLELHGRQVTPATDWAATPPAGGDDWDQLIPELEINDEAEMTLDTPDGPEEPIELQPFIIPAAGGGNERTSHKRDEIAKIGKVKFNNPAFHDGTLSSAHDHRMYPERLGQAAISSFLEKCKTETMKKWEANAPPTETGDANSCLQYKYATDGLAFIVTGFEDAMSGPYRLGWGQVHALCTLIAERQTAAPRDTTWLGVIKNSVGKKVVTFLMLADYVTIDEFIPKPIPGRYKGSAFYNGEASAPGPEPAPTPPDTAAGNVCPGKKSRRDDGWTQCLQLPGTSYFVRWRRTATPVACGLLGIVIRQAQNQLIADDRGLGKDLLYSRFTSAPFTNPAEVQPGFENGVFDLVATTGGKITRRVVMILVYKFAKYALAHRWDTFPLAAGTQSIPAMAGEIVDAAGVVLATWGWGEETGTVRVENPDGSAMMGTIIRHDELR